MLNCLFVGLGGFVGAVCRYLAGLLPVAEKCAFPVKTLCINVLGSLAIGLIAAGAAKAEALDPRWMLFLKVGLCGGFTTFSTFALESLGLLESGRWGAGLLYVAGSAAMSVLAVFAGRLLLP